MGWKDVSHNGFTVLTHTLKSYSHSVAQNYTPEFTVPPGTDFTVICNYGSTDLSSSAHVEMFYSDVPGGTFANRGNTVGGMNATTALIDAAKVVLVQDVSTTKQYPRYKLKVTGNAAGSKGGGLVKFVIYYARGEQ